ncbi:uncharacterized protein Moror_770 [Moniliophthora roreri MCA 2997]|uniref:Chromo domain-containing protein n=1 Tax=Moniliophthora roreri (strain MCA 2997) TaxID=1381753 RepID=V2X840_MONRO|nr:uncharacterized protein Moror_770 [Moniliophthora roreri MCA 2997]
MPPTRKRPFIYQSTTSLSNHETNTSGYTTRRKEQLDAQNSALSSLSSDDDEGASTPSTRSRKTFLRSSISSVTLARKRKPKREQRSSSLTKIMIAGCTLRPTAAFDTFWHWCAERKAIDDRRRAGESYPWTEDKYLQQYYFCNPYRVLDRGCQFLVREVIEKGSQEPQEIIFRILLYDIFTRIETYEMLEERLGPLTWKKYRRQAYVKVLRDAYAGGMPLYTPAFMKILPGKRENFYNHLEVLERIMNDDLASRMQNAKDPAELHTYLLTLPGMGAFTSYQLLLNLSYSSLYKFSANDYVVPCVGSSSGLVKLFGKSVKEARKSNRQIDALIMKWMMETQDEHFRRLGIQFSRLGPNQLPMDLSDIEHSVCEVDKYSRLVHPTIQGEGDRTHIRRIYKPEFARVLPAIVLPKAWDHPRQTSSLMRLPECSLMCTVEDIIKHRELDDDGGNEYLVHWQDSSGDRDTWLTEQVLSDTMGGKEALAAYQKKQFIIDYIGDVVDCVDGRWFYVYWEGYGPEDATWEPEENLLEDALEAVTYFLEKGVKRRRRR